MKQLRTALVAICFLLVVFLLPGQVRAAEVVAEGTCGENLTWVLTDDGTLTISGTGDMTDYASASDTPWYSQRENIKAVIIESGMTGVGDYAFAYCSGVTSITIPDSVTTIGNCAFQYCSSLTDVTLPYSVTNIDEYAFRECSSLIGVYITDIAAWCNISFDEPESNPLYHANKLYLNGELVKKLVIPDCVTGIGGYAFSYCSSLTSVKLPDSVTSIGEYAFSYCSSMTSITIGDSVTNIGNCVFQGCSSLTDVTLPDSVTNIGNCAFADCSGLKSITILDGVISIGSSAFWGCRGLTGITIPDSVTSIGDYAFRYCSGLTGITIPDSVTSIGDGAFYGCSGLTSITIPDGVTGIGDSAFSDCSGLSDVTIGNSVSSIGASAFAYCSSLTDVTIPGSVTVIGKAAFYACSSLTDVTIQKGVTAIGGSAFMDCSSLTSFTVQGSLTATGDNAFYRCSSLADVYITDIYAWWNVTFGKGSSNPVNYGAQVHIMDSEGNEITEFVLDSSVTEIPQGGFYGCSSLTSVTIPESVTVIGSYAFQRCSGLKSMVIPDSVTTIGMYAFQRCTGLTDVVLSKNITVINTSTFQLCSSLTHIVIPDGVTTIKAHAFNGCSSLTGITIPDSVTEIAVGFIDAELVLGTEAPDTSHYVVLYYKGTTQQWENVEDHPQWTIDRAYSVVCPEEVKLSLDKAAAEAIDQQVGEDVVTIVAEHKDGSRLNAAQTAALEGKTVGMVLSLDAFLGDTEVASFGNGKATVSIPYELSEGKEDTALHVASVDENGNVFILPATYADGVLTFLTSGFADFAVLETEPGAYAAKVGETGYDSLQDALDAATAGETVLLQRSAEVSSLVISDDVCLDLNGWDLCAEYFVAMNGAEVVDNAGMGLLKSKHVLLDADNPQMPIWDEAAGGYRFFTMKDQQKYLSQTATGFTFIAKPALGSSANDALMAQSGTNGLSVRLRMRWQTAGGNEVTQLFSVKATDLTTIYTISKKVIQLTVSGAGMYAGILQTDVYLVSETGVIWSSKDLLYTGG